MEPDQKEQYVRWQNYRINQLSFSINLFLTFAVASLAYAINLKLTNTADLPAVGLLATIYWWSSSVVLGTISTLSRLIDFRLTARKIKNSSKNDKCVAKIFGKVTWGTFWGQTAAYVIGGYQFIVNVVIE